MNIPVLTVRDENGNIIEIPAIKGDKGEGYTLTEEDKRDIASIVAASFVSLTDLATDIPAVPTKVSAFENDAGYLTKEQVQSMIDRSIAKKHGDIANISFSIEDFQFQAEEGMTWEEWVNSEYNSDGACIYNEGSDTIRFVEYSLDVLSSNIPVKGSDSIISGYFYYLS